MDEELWDLERRFWTEGSEHYCAALHPESVMVFVEPAGILSGDEIIEQVEAADRWRDVEMTERTLTRPSPDVAVLAYRATARREGTDPYSCGCSSTYLRDGGEWKLVQHQQTPAA